MQKAKIAREDKTVEGWWKKTLEILFQGEFYQGKHYAKYLYT